MVNLYPVLTRMYQLRFLNSPCVLPCLRSHQLPTRLRSSLIKCQALKPHKIPLQFTQWFRQEVEKIMGIFSTQFSDVRPNETQLVLSTVSFPVNWSAAWQQGESQWAGAGSLSWLGNGPNVPCSAYPASQMDDDEVMGVGGEVEYPRDWREEENTLILTSSWGEDIGIDGNNVAKWGRTSFYQKKIYRASLW